ncbi:MAG: diadenylate cyclase CdaA [Candidatus Promineifilaceae bacterium]
MFNIQSIIDAFIFRLQSFGWSDLLDLLLVTAAIYILLQVLRRSQAAFVLRAALVVAGIFLLVNLLLPLPTFGIIINFATIAIGITLLFVLAPELRRWLDRFGRNLGFSFGGRESMAGQIIPQVTSAIEHLSASKIGGLIVLEGTAPLTDIISTGIPVHGQVTSELLETIFFDKTPLHDGAAIIREDEVIAAGCVLPLSDQVLHGWRRLGTRHRAAVGMSEVSDALTIVVSEETGAISVAEDSRLRQDLDRGELTQTMRDFYTRGPDISKPTTWRFWEDWHFPGPRAFFTDLIYLLLAVALALVATTAVRAANDPIVQGRQEGVALQVKDLPADTVLASTPPQTVGVVYDAPASELPSIGTTPFQASISLAGVSTGVTRVPVEVTTTSTAVTIIDPVPAEVDVSVAEIISKTVPVSVTVEGADTLSAAYVISGDPMAVPTEVTVTGPESSIERTATAGATVSVENATSTVRGNRPLVAYDVEGIRVSDVTIEPSVASVTVIIRARGNARDVGVRAVTTGSPPDGYWLSSLTVEPVGVTIQGDPAIISEMGSFVDTLPVDLSEAAGELVIEVPLDLPADVQALDSNGNALSNVTVTALVAARSGDLLTERPVDIINDRGTNSIEIDPPTVQLLLSGPLPTLNRIEQDPELVSVVIDALDLPSNRSVEVTPTVVAPDDIRVQLVDTSVLVTTKRNNN